MADRGALKIVNVEGSDAHKSQERRYTVNLERYCTMKKTTI